MKRTQAVILAAGVGQRLDQAGNATPKCLLRFAGISLLQRQLIMLAGAGVARTTLVVGYEAMRIEQEIAAVTPALADMAVTTLFNADYERGSVLSCLAAAPALGAGDVVVLMDADVLCDARMIDRLLASPHDNGLLVDRGIEPGDEPVKLAACGGQPVGFGKHLGVDVASDTVGESVGFFRLAPAMARELACRCRRYGRAGRADAPYEHPLRDLMLAHSQAFGFEDITGLPWIEIDFPQDVRRARTQILPRLRERLVTS